MFSSRIVLEFQSHSENQEDSLKNQIDNKTIDMSFWFSQISYSF